MRLFNARRLAAGALFGVVASSATLPGQGSQIVIDKSTLANGLRLQLVEDHSSQVVAVSLWFDVGARDELKGKTGFAHLFEHMMFQGSANIKKPNTSNSSSAPAAGLTPTRSTTSPVTTRRCRPIA